VRPRLPILNLKHGNELTCGESEFIASAGAMCAFAVGFIAFPCFCPSEILLLVAIVLIIHCPRRFLIDATQQGLNRLPGFMGRCRHIKSFRVILSENPDADLTQALLTCEL
jgi:hypothetical protein